MLDAVAAFFRQLAQSIRVADLFDVALVSVFLYAFLTWVRRDTRPGTTWRIATVLVFFSAVYLLAGLFSMYLVERVLSGLFIAFLVAAVVLFQAEIRRMIDRIGSWSFQRPSAPSRSEQTLDTITEATGRMAEERTGALMAVRGRDSWEGATQGGIPLEGRLSLPLLYSLFDEKTPGHDGAVLIEEDRAVRFGAHLPLASELPEASRSGGTRHAAALGLSEQCDAFVIVVSEERGTISVAEEGQLDELDAAGDLRARLGRFWEEHYGSHTEEERWWGRKSLQTALLSVLMACLLWFAFAYEPGSTQRSFQNLPVVFNNVEPTWMIGEPQPPEVSVTLSGSERAFELIEPSELTVSFPLSEVEEGANDLLVTEDNLNLPGGLRLQEARPQAVHVEAQRLRMIRLPVRIETTVPPPDSVRLRAEPDTVELMIPRDDGAAPEAVPTEDVVLDSIRDATSVQADLLPPEDTRLPDGETRHVEVRLDTTLREASPSDGE